MNTLILLALISVTSTDAQTPAEARLTASRLSAYQRTLARQKEEATLLSEKAKAELALERKRALEFEEENTTWRAKNPDTGLVWATGGKKRK